MWATVLPLLVLLVLALLVGGAVAALVAMIIGAR
jgi:hypothetical protein